MEDLLFLVHRIPYPPNKGDKIRSFNFLKRLSSHYRVHLGAFIDDRQDEQYIPQVDSLCVNTCYVILRPWHAKMTSIKGLLTDEALSLPYYSSSSLQAWVDSIIEKYSIRKVLVFSSVMGQFIRPSLAINMVVDFVDVDSDKWRQYANKKTGLAKWVYQREAEYLLRYDQALAVRARISLFVSKEEADLFKQLVPIAKHSVTHVNNGVDVVYFSPEWPLPSPYGDVALPTLVFTGAMDYWANVEAVVWFAEDVLPLVLSQHPGAKFYIVGSKPTARVLALASHNIIVTGTVADVRPYIRHADLVVVPLRIARGIQNKVLEAMAMAKVVVATTAAIEGIGYDNDLAVWVHDEAMAMADCINTLLMQGQVTARNNRIFVEQKFSWQQALQQLLALLQS
jgi:sugar transferase (PEP-CTERM/EpsH1 system associated)